MKVTLMNKDEVANLYSHWGDFSRVCYNTNEKVPSERIGKHCKDSGHYSGSRTRYFEFLVENCPRFCTDQAVRHEEGVVKNVQSFRYVDKNLFAYEVPKEILDNTELLNKYHSHMKNTINLYDEIQEYVLDKTKSKERANEQARYVLPMSTHGSFVIGFTMEALIHFMHKRICVRTEDISNQLAREIKKEVLKIMPDLEKDLVSQCEYLTWCPESKSCGKFKKKGE